MKHSSWQGIFGKITDYFGFNKETQNVPKINMALHTFLHVSHVINSAVLVPFRKGPVCMEHGTHVQLLEKKLVRIVW